MDENIALTIADFGEKLKEILAYVKQIFDSIVATIKNLQK